MRKLLPWVVFVALAAPLLAETKPLLEGTVLPAVPPKKPLLDVSNARAKTGRVPGGYGKLGLSQMQKERIYGIQAVYAARIKELEDEIETLKEEQKLQVKTVLNNVQRLQVERYELEKEQKEAE